MLHRVDWQLLTDVSGLPISPIFRGQSFKEDSLTLEDETDRLSRNDADYQYTLRNSPEEQKSHLHRGGSLKSRSILQLYY
jgi:hypothetical protein